MNHQQNIDISIAANHNKVLLISSIYAKCFDWAVHKQRYKKSSATSSGFIIHFVQPFVF
jgi:hypothetical protein